MDRLFRERLCNRQPQPDEAGRIRLDDWEMTPEIQAEVDQLWAMVNTENLLSLADVQGYESSFLRLFGFGLAGVDYTAETDPNVRVPSLG
jgi:enoyl-[acyl-carrier protein] reductase / trans-2-enoyl-CoA reductase (NAD+)